MVHAFNPNMKETEANESLNSRPASDSQGYRENGGGRWGLPMRE